MEATEQFAIQFLNWCNDNFHLHSNGGYYAKTNSKYFDITKYAGKEKPTTYYTSEELMELYKQREL